MFFTIFGVYRKPLNIVTESLHSSKLINVQLSAFHRIPKNAALNIYQAKGCIDVLPSRNYCEDNRKESGGREFRGSIKNALQVPIHWPGD
jgi:hypothetical protein